MGWAGLVRVDGNITYKWLGQPATSTFLNHTILSNIQITPTRTILNITAGPVDLTVTFLSPIEASFTPYEHVYLPNPFFAQTDLVLLSLPLAYVALEASSNDGRPHDVQVYLDVTGGMREFYEIPKLTFIRMAVCQ